VGRVLFVSHISTCYLTWVKNVLNKRGRCLRKSVLEALDMVGVCNLRQKQKNKINKYVICATSKIVFW